MILDLVRLTNRPAATPMNPALKLKLEALDDDKILLARALEEASGKYPPLFFQNVP
jgi:hypothetical protein